MNFVESIKTCFRKYADFSGRGSRPEYWWFFLFCVLVQIAAEQISSSLGLVMNLVLLLPSLAAGARRLHDTWRSGWWQLLSVPVLLVGILLWFLGDEYPTDEASELGIAFIVLVALSVYTPLLAMFAVRSWPEDNEHGEMLQPIKKQEAKNP